MAKQSEPGSEERIDTLMVDVLERLSAGDAKALDEVCERHPDLASEIRARIGALSEMSLLPSDAAAMAFPERLGEFRLVRRLGGGGMGVVYEAVQESLGRTVALKLIRPEHLYFARSRERFQRETEAVARLAHPAIVAIYTVGEAQGTPYFAMEMIRGATLSQVLEQVSGFAPERLLGADLRAAVMTIAPSEQGPESMPALFEGTWAQTCARAILRMTEALAHAHQRGVLHRDIKPSNVAVTPEGRVVLLDFGLAGIEDEMRLTASSSAIGSVLYMAPEQIAGRTNEIDARTDVYALGVTLYEMLTLHTPYLGSDTEKTRAAILDGQAPPIRARNGSIPRDIEIVCLKAMECDRARRYASMEDFGRDLSNALEGRPIEARPASVAYRTQRWMRRHPATTTASVLGALLVTVLPSALFLQQRISNAKLEEALDAETKARTHATDEERRANENAHLAEQVASFLVDLFGASDPYITGRRDLTAREVLDRAVVRIENELEDQPALQARLYERIGASYINLDLYEQALVPLERALDAKRSAFGDEDPVTAIASVQYVSAARLSGRQGLTDAIRRAYEVLERAQASASDRLNAKALLAGCMLDDGATLQATELLEQARAELGTISDANLDVRWLVLTMLATSQNRLAHFTAAEASAREALALEPVPGPGGAPWRIAALNNLAQALHYQGRDEEALAVHEQLLPLARAFYGEQNPNFAQIELNFGSTALALGRDDEAARAIDHGFEVMRSELPAGHPKTRGALVQLTDLRLKHGRFDELIGLLDETLEASARGGEHDTQDGVLFFWKGTAAIAKGDWSVASEALRRGREALANADAETIAALDVTLARALVEQPAERAEAVALAHASAAAATPNTRVVAHYVLACAASAEARADEAERELREAVAIASPSALRHAANVKLGEILVARGELDDGCARIAAGLAGLERALAANHAELADARQRLEASGAAAACGARERAPVEASSDR